jgi:hypothetical protein
MITILFLLTNCDFQGFVGGCIVVMKEPVVVVPKFQFFIAYILSSISKHHSKSQS